MACELCESPGGELLWCDPTLRVVRVGDPDYPGFCRVIWQTHIKEMTDLSAAERTRFMQIVFAVERVLRDLLQPDKINLASLGNATPHLHWHVIPRFTTDRHFPDPVWASPRRSPRASPLDTATVAAAMRAHLADIAAQSAVPRGTPY
jgi:diadenosine tetraphosphate (Ap4A) HIT family hydrolase